MKLLLNLDEYHSDYYSFLREMDLRLTEDVLNLFSRYRKNEFSIEDLLTSLDKLNGLMFYRDLISEASIASFFRQCNRLSEYMARHPKKRELYLVDIEYLIDECIEGLLSVKEQHFNFSLM